MQRPSMPLQTEQACAEQAPGFTGLLDEIAAALVLADAADRESMGSILPLLEQLKVAADKARDTAWLARGKEWFARLQAGIAGDQGAAQRALDALVARVSNAQTKHGVSLASPPSRPASAAVTPAAQQPPLARDDGAFRCPDWVEPEVLADFLADQNELTGAFEAEILDLEQDPAAIAALRRHLHSLKGEAGMLGMDDLAQICHALEDFLDNEQAVRTGIDLLLEVKDWMAMALRRYSEARLPAPPAAVIENRLQQRCSGSPAGPPAVAPAPAAVGPGLAAAVPAAAAIQLRETIKIDLERVDQLVELIGELVIAESMVVNAPEIVANRSPRVLSKLNLLGRITRELQDAGLRMRMVPLRGLFQKMARLVRDVAQRSNKRVRLVVAGQETEIDRSIVERIADPIMHIMRNAVSHGIEDHQRRIAAGKPAEGTVRLSGHAEGGSIIIEVTDDGAGLDREAILRRARRLGLVEGQGDDERLSDHDIDNLIFHPGLSTAVVVTEVAGRGVGLDVVKKSITAIRGRIVVSSVPGQGTSFRIVLPLTLAIIDGMVVACGAERYIIPTLSIVESMQVTRAMLTTCAGRWELVHVRGTTLPLLRLAQLLDVPGAIEDPTRGLVVIVEGIGRRLALLVDEVITQQQVVIKTLGEGINHSRLISGGAIMCDGRVGLILNVEDLGLSIDKQGGAGNGKGPVLTRPGEVAGRGVPRHRFPSSPHTAQGRQTHESTGHRRRRG